MCQCCYAPVIPAIGFFCSGGRCVFISMKKRGAGVAKVVNPLGTVVTVRLDDPAEVDCKSEEAIIHENCDEALFRPVVAPKSLHYTDSKHLLPEKLSKNKPSATDNICTKSLTSTTEVTFKISSKGEEKYPLVKDVPVKHDRSIELQTRTGKNKKCKELSSKNEKNHKTSAKLEIDLDFMDSLNSSTHCKQNNNNKCDSQIGYVDSSYKTKVLNVRAADKTPISESSKKSDLAPSKANICEKSEGSFCKREDGERGNTKIPELITDNILKLDYFEDAQELCGEILEDNSTRFKKMTKMLQNEKPQLVERDTHSSSEENIAEEKNIIKKPRKPKPKLGVRIPSVNKEGIVKTEQKVLDEVTPSVKTKKSWSGIVAATPPKELLNLNVDDLHFEETHAPHLMDTSRLVSSTKTDEIKTIESFNRKKCFSSDLVEPGKQCLNSFGDFNNSKIVATTQPKELLNLNVDNCHFEKAHVPHIMDTSGSESSAENDVIKIIESFNRKKCFPSDLVEPEKQCLNSFEDLTTSKIQKSSDDEKVSSSQTETTESDDSAKITAVSANEKNNSTELQVVANSCSQIKSAKRKSKKKKK